MLCSTVREILAGTEEKYGPKDAIRYKVSKNEIASKTYTQLREDSESFSCVLRDLGEQGSHIAVIGMTSYEWLVAYFGTVDSGSVVVPLDVNLPAEDVCDLIEPVGFHGTRLRRGEKRRGCHGEGEMPPAAQDHLHAEGGSTASRSPASGSCWKSTEGALTMSPSRISSARSCSPRAQRGRARASC